MIYFDNSATSFPKPRGMVMAMEDCLLNYCGNPGRSGHYMSIKTGEEVYKARRTLANFINAQDPRGLIFTKNTTEALNLGIKGVLREGDHVVTTSMEHNSVLRPLKELENFGISNTIVYGDKNGFVSEKNIEAAITPKTSLVISTHAANTTGTIMPIEKISKIAHRHGAKFMVDGAQSAGTVEIDVKKMDIDLLAMAGHKGLMGPQGTGLIYISPNCDLYPLLEGGTGTESKNVHQPKELPEALEAGTLNAPAIVGLGYSTRYIEQMGINNIRQHEEELITRLEEALRNMEKITVYGPIAAKNKTGVCLCNIKDMGCEEATDILNSRFGIMVRGGFHCAGLAHKTIGTWETGAIRISVGAFNTKKEIDALIDALLHLTNVK